MTDHEYHQQALREAYRHEQEVDKAPLADRKEAQAEWLQSMKTEAGTIGERINWMLDGNYGQGEMLKAQTVIRSPRMNRVAALSQLIACYEWQCPTRMAADAWKKLTPQQQGILKGVIENVIHEYKPEPNFELGDQVRITGTTLTGEVSFNSGYDAYLGQYRYKVAASDGTRKNWNESSLIKIKKD